MKTKIAKAALAGTAMTAAIVLGAGTASAATVGTAGSAGTGTPTADYQVCGTAYVGADTHVGAPPAGAKAVEGVTVTGQLYNLFGGTVGSPFTATTASDGTWCLQGDSTMANTVTGGGRVGLTFSPATVSDGAGTYAGKMSGGSGAGTDASINGFEFYDHAYPSPSTSAKSAWKVNVVYS